MELSIQQIFMLAVDTCLVVMLVVDFWMLVRNAKHSKKDFGYELAKMELEFTKDIHFCDCLAKLDERIDKLEEIHGIKNNEENKEDKKDE